MTAHRSQPVQSSNVSVLFLLTFFHPACITTTTSFARQAALLLLPRATAMSSEASMFSKQRCRQRTYRFSLYGYIGKGRSSS
jgi:hypothetical protein